MTSANIINNLTKQNQDNYETYLTRMTNSAGQSTKANIARYIQDGTILDIGCGSGVLMRILAKQYSRNRIHGLEVNSTAAELCRKAGFTVYEAELEDFALARCEEYDNVIFSSVLHEISSYEQNPDKRFTIVPIENALGLAYQLLKPGGRLIVRDGVKFASNRTMNLSFINPEVAKAFEKFIKETPIDDYQGEGKIENNCLIAPANCLKEFLFTYTWGTESWPREINEQYGILPCGFWLNAVREAGFKIDRYSTSNEEYFQYLQKDFGNTLELQDLLAENTILIVANKI